MVTLPTPSRAGSLPQGSRPHPKSRLHPKFRRSRACSRKRCVRRWRGCLCRRHREQALLLQIFVGHKGPCTPQIKCGSEPARESGVSGDEHVDLAAAFAGKPGSHRVLGVLKIPIKPPDNCRSRACSRKRCVRRWRGCLCRRLREQALLLQIFCRTQSPCTPKSNVGASLLAKTVCQAMERLSVPTPSRASFAPTDFCRTQSPGTSQIKCGSEPARESGLSDTASINGGYRRRKYRHSHQSRPCAPPRNTHRPATSTTAPARFLRRPNHAPVGVRY